MRTKTAILSAVALAAGIASSMAQANVYSVNIVGYVNVVAPSGGKYILVSNPLNAPTNTLQALLGSAPSGSQFLKWNDGVGFAPTSTKLAATWNNNYTLKPGEGGYLRTPASSVVDFTNTFVGEVLQGSLTNTTATGFAIRGSQIPVATNVNALSLTANLKVGDQVLTYNPVSQGFNPTRTLLNPGAGTWSGPAPVINVGEAFFVRASNGSNWVINFTAP